MWSVTRQVNFTHKNMVTNINDYVFLGQWNEAEVHLQGRKRHHCHLHQETHELSIEAYEAVSNFFLVNFTKRTHRQRGLV